MGNTPKILEAGAPGFSQNKKKNCRKKQWYLQQGSWVFNTVSNITLDKWQL